MDAMSLYSLLSSLWVVWFSVLFTGICVWAFWPTRRKTMEENGRIPLRGEN